MTYATERRARVRRESHAARRSLGFHVAVAWFLACGGPPLKCRHRRTLNTVQRLMQRHIGLEILESTFVLAAEEAGYAVDMQEGSALAPSINVGIRAANTIERECEARSRALGTYASRALARYSDWDVPFDQQRSSSTYWQVRR